MRQGQALQPAVLVVGFDNLPVTQLPNGCQLLVAPAASVFQIAGGQGEAGQLLPIPPQPQLAGTLLFAQWLQNDFTGPAVMTEIAAVRVGL